MVLGILGTGMIVKDFLNTVRELNFEKLYLFATEKSRDKAQEMKNNYNIDRIYYDYDELLESDVDTIYVALPNSLHYEFSKKAMEAGKHLIIEKPITANIKELRSLVECSEKNKIMFFEAVNFLHNPAFISFKENLKKLGRIRLASFNYSQYSSRYDAFKRGEIKPAFDWEKAGGVLMDLNIYNVNAAVSLFGKPGSVNYFANIDKSIDTSGVLILRYKDFIVTCKAAKDSRETNICSVQGDEASLEINSPVSQMDSFSINYNDGRESEHHDVSESCHRLFNEFKEFKKIIENNEREKFKKLLDQSITVAEILQEARIQEQIVFQNDKN